MKTKKWQSETYFEIGFLVLVFIGLLLWMVVQPLGSTPDEKMRYSIAQYIYVHNQLPKGGEAEILDHSWGFSYAFQPILPYIIACGFMKIAALFFQENYFLLLSARMVSVICGVITAYFICKIAKRVFDNKATRWMFIFLAALWPQGLFVHTYVNTDSMALMSTAMMFYAWLIGLETRWNRKSCILLAIGISLCALSYYNAYGFILSSMLLFVGSFVVKKEQKWTLSWQDMLKKGIFISVLVLILAGWWFIRSGILYHGDFLGLATRNKFAEVYAREDLKPSRHATYLKQGYSIIYMLLHSNFIILTCRSYIAMFGNMTLPIYNWIYRVYYGFSVLAVIGLVLPVRNREFFSWLEKERRLLLYSCMTLAIIIPNALNLWAAYSYDYQPQGRYSLPMLIPMVCFLAIGLHTLLTKIIRTRKIVMVLEGAIATFALLVSYLAIKDFIYPMYYNTFMLWFKGTFLACLKCGIAF